MSQRRYLPCIAAAVVAWAMLCPVAHAAKLPQGPRRVAVPDVQNYDAPFWWAQINPTKPHNVPWDDSDFATLARNGMNGVEINVDWASIEPQKDQYDFKLMDRYMAAAAKSNLRIYLLFWESMGPGSPPLWIPARDISSDGVPAAEPPWWDESARKAYFNFVAHTIDHVKTSPGFGGVYASYGWLDSEWGMPPKGSHGVTGYAPADIQEFYRWLPRTYKTLANFNQHWHTSFHQWSDVPAAKPGDPLFSLYQEFRQYSAEEGFDAISHLVREHTNAPMLYSWGGEICGHMGPAVQGNAPDMFFRVAKKYHAIINLDDANVPGLALLFGSMARSYRVPLLEEWTPGQARFSRTPQWLSHVGLAAPFAVGEDFFTYPPPQTLDGFVHGWNAYTNWHATLVKVIHGRTPEQPVAVIVPTRKIVLSADLNPYPNLTTELTDFWRHYRVLPHFITDEQITHGVVDLQQFRAVVDLGDEITTIPALKKYSEKHPVLKTMEQALPFLHPYAAMDPPADSLEVVPTVDGSSVWLTLANTEAKHMYSGTIKFDPAAVGLGSTSFAVKNAKTGEIVPATRSSDGTIQLQVKVPPSELLILHLNLSRPNAKPIAGSNQAKNSVAQVNLTRGKHIP